MDERAITGTFTGNKEWMTRLFKLSELRKLQRLLLYEGQPQ